ncbi:MAG: UvrD-helicase domain-containing protein [Solirubrobacteraceae bacterium]|nr:UvrD-helicase domain-containing protein [Solirubrobacteraceae bacterium]
MAVVIYAPNKDGLHDGSLGKKIHAFIRKVFEDDTLPGLHIEPIKAAIDPKVRTGRVDAMYRAVLFKVQAAGGAPHYIFTGVWPHDEAIEIARKSVLKVNPVNGLPELLIASEVPLPQASAGPHSDQVADSAGPVVGTGARTGDAVTAGLGVDPGTDSSTGEGAAGGEDHQVPSLPLLERTGITLEQLTDELGIDPDLARRALAVRTDDEIMQLAERAVEWQGLALLDLAAGASIDDVRAAFGIDGPKPVLAEDEEAQLLEGLQRPAARMQFAWLEDDDELRRAIEDGSFAKWRIFLHPEQRRYVDRGTSGPFRLSGGAGTGKTVVLLHRARRLARQHPSARVVLTTYTRNLADALERDLRSLDPTLPLAERLGDPGVRPTGVDAAAAQVLSRATPDVRAQAVEQVLGIAGDRTATQRPNAKKAWDDAISAAGGSLPPDLRSPGFFAAEYEQIVLPHRIVSREQYLRVRRPGRGVALGRRQRVAVWDVVSAYRAAAAIPGTLDFAEVCAIAAAIGERAEHRIADHVLVDEGQDLSPPQWQFLRSLVAEGPDDLFIAEDAQQRIYGQRTVLGRYGIQIVGRSRRLSLNYRTTQQVLRFATDVLAGQSYADLDDEITEVDGYRSARRGPTPTRIGVSSLTDELERAAAVVRGWLDDGVEPDAIGVLARDQSTVDVVSRGFEDRGVPIRQVTRSAGPSGRPQLMTMHRAKGMEFSRVLLFAADAELLPAAYLLKSVPDAERDDLIQRERSLFYVAATRARDELVVLWEGEGSEFLRA